MTPNVITMKQLRLPNHAGEMLAGVLHDNGCRDLAILCHGFGSSKEFSTIVDLATALNDIGLSTFRFDFSGNGESQGEFQYGNYWKEVEDLRYVILYWAQQGYTIKVIIGHSKGGNAVLLYASKYNDVYLVISLSARFDLSRGMEKRLGENYIQEIERKGSLEVRNKFGNIEYQVTKESLRERLSTNMESAVIAIPKKCRVLIVHGSNDDIVPSDDAIEYHKLISNNTLIIIGGVDHYYKRQRRNLISFVLDFIKNNVKDNKPKLKLSKL